MQSLAAFSYKKGVAARWKMAFFSPRMQIWLVPDF